METFLSPIEKPRGLMMKLTYYFTRRALGKVITPIKVHSARMPAVFGLFYAKIPKLDKKLMLAPEMRMLIREQVARTNVCAFCMDATRWAVINESMNLEKFDSLDAYDRSPLFTDAERAALDYVTKLAREKKVSEETFARLSAHYSEGEICEIVWLAASEHINNVTNIALNIHSDMLCNLALEKRESGRRSGALPTP